ncbi:MAG TPA: GNAT family N-acetyltransferase, partial [Solirubrobacteraceae bacterium]|nr:GNAT family N-acetyltransferase [Solirubrobacteraceae bacterium]
MEIRDATAADWPAIWPFLHEIVAAGETYAYDRELTEAQARRLWMIEPPGRTVVAVDDDGAVVGTANMYANRPGPGSHVASASFMVDPNHGGRGT